MVRLLILVSALVSLASPYPQASDTSLPTFVSGALPTYPPLAVLARIQGDVRLRVTTDGSSVHAAEVRPDSPPMLRDAARQAVLTWRFTAHQPKNFDVVVTYGLRDGTCYAPDPPTPLTFRLNRVEVLETPIFDCLEVVTTDRWGRIIKTSRSPERQVRRSARTELLTISSSPESARGSGIDGDVRIEISRCGHDRRPVAGPGALVDAALAMLETAKFSCDSDTPFEVLFQYRWVPDCGADPRPLIRVEGLSVEISERWAGSCK